MSLDVLPDRIVDKIHFEPNTGCWLWTGKIDRDGYGHTVDDRQYWLTHRYTYTRMVSLIAAGLYLDHTCRVRHCVNPSHLRAVTPRENALRNSHSVSAHEAVQTQCHRGHPFDDANTYRTPRGHRTCRACNRASVAAYEARRRGRP